MNKLRVLPIMLAMVLALVPAAIAEDAKPEPITVTVFVGNPRAQPTADNKIFKLIEDELGIPEDMLIPWDTDEKGTLGPIKLVAAYRDMLEGGKPQL